MKPSIVNSRRVINRILSSFAIDFEVQPIGLRTRTGRNSGTRCWNSRRSGTSPRLDSEYPCHLRASIPPVQKPDQWEMVVSRSEEAQSQEVFRSLKFAPWKVNVEQEQEVGDGSDG
jgi:hypothetical protein